MPDLDVRIGRIVERLNAQRAAGKLQKKLGPEQRVKVLAMTEAEAKQLRTFVRTSWPQSSLRERIEDLCR